MNLDGKVALITGGGSGIGAGIAERFVADGAKICITGLRQEKLDQIARKLPAGTVLRCAGDVTKVEDVSRMVETTLVFTGKLDVLVNNAAIDPGGATVVETDSELWHRVLETNLTGPLCSPSRPRWISVQTRSDAMRSVRAEQGPLCWKSPSVPSRKYSIPIWTAFSGAYPRWSL